MSILANICTCFFCKQVFVVCVCPIIIKLGQMVEGVCALRSVKDVNFNQHLLHVFLKKLEYTFFLDTRYIER